MSSPSYQCAAFLLLPALLTASFAGQAQTKPAAGHAPISLKWGKAITQPLQAGQVYDYQIALKAGQALQATVEQQGIDVVVTAYDPAGTKLASFDSPTEGAYKEFVTVVAANAGRYRLRVAPLEPKVAPGTFVITLTGILTPAQYVQRQAEERQQADDVTAYLRAPHPDQTMEEQRAEMLKRAPAILMLSAKTPELEAAHWLEGTWALTRTFFATPTQPESTASLGNVVLRFNPAKPALLEIDREANGKFEPMMAFESMSRQWVLAFMESNAAGTYWALLKGPDWQNNQLVMEGETCSMGLVGRERRTWTKVDDRTLRVRMEERQGNGIWSALYESQYMKAAPSVITAK